VAEWVRLAWHQPLLVDVSAVGAVQILDQDLGALHKDAGVLSRNPSFVSTVAAQVNVRKSPAGFIRPPDDDFDLAGWKA